MHFTYNELKKELAIHRAAYTYLYYQIDFIAYKITDNETKQMLNGVLEEAEKYFAEDIKKDYK